MNNLKLFYNKEAEDSNYGWEHDSLPIGNGYMGANIFGIVERERIQITENSLCNDSDHGGLNNFAEIYLKFKHNDVTDYERGLCLDDAVAYVKYACNGVQYLREYFTSYPNKVLVMRLTANQKGALSFEIAPEIPFVKDYAKTENDGGGKSGIIKADNDSIILSGKLKVYNVLFEGQIKILKNTGRTVINEKSILIENSDEVVLIFALGTNYELSSHVFLEDDPKKKLKHIDPHEKVSEIINNASLPYEQLKQTHIEDYTRLFSRVNVYISGDDYSDICTDELLRMSSKKTIPYLEILYFQYGRYLLISSSRKGCLPCNLQGVWNCHDRSPWGSGYWHNINVQMNYWPAFNTNLVETFESYVDFFNAYLPKAQKYADAYIKEHNPENFVDSEGENGWTIGTGSYPYTISAPGGHSGPGTGGLTSKLFWDYYDFTRDKEILKNITFPVLEGMSKFLTKTVKYYDGKPLVSFSASPEQMLNGEWIPNGTYYQTVGCAFDQQMIYENGRDLLRASDLLDIQTETTNTQLQQINFYEPVNIGWSGQIKEYLEEKFYGEVGEYRHRHISQLIGLYPGTVINSQTDAWLDAAKYTLNERGDQSTGWALAHRINVWARTGDGNRCYKLFKTLLSSKTMPNLWDTHPPFQIDGNLGGTSGFAEMLLQSHEDFISVLPAIPDAWPKGKYSGLTARGSFEVSARWENGCANYIKVISKKGEILKLKYNNIAEAVITIDGKSAEYKIIDSNMIELNTVPLGVYEFNNIKQFIKVSPPNNLKVQSSDMTLTWQGDENADYNVYRATDSEAQYTLIAQQITDCSFKDSIDFMNYETVTYKVTACKNGCESVGVIQVLNHATQLDIDRYRNQLRGRKQL